MRIQLDRVLNPSHLRLLIAILCTAIYTLLIGIVLKFTLSDGSAEKAQVLREFFISPESINPEPVERTLYIIGLFTSPIVLIGIWTALKNRRLTYERFLSRTISIWGLGFFIFSFFLICHRINNANGYLFFRTSWLWQNPLSFLTFAVVGAGTYRGFAKNFRPTRMVLWLLIPLLAWAAKIRTVRELDPYLFRFHFESFFSPILQSFNGKVLLLDQFPLYGLYGTPIAALLRVLNPTFSISALSWILWFLAFFSLSSWAVFCFSMIRNKTLASLTLVSTIAFCVFSVPFEEFNHYGVIVDSYFQYFPIRTLFPGILFFAVSFHKARPLPLKWFFVIALILGWAPYWNFDSGLVCLGTWGLIGVNGQFQKKRFFQKLLPLLLCALALFLDYWLHGLLFYHFHGTLPNWDPLLKTNSVLYSTGINAIALPLLHPWIYTIVLFWTGCLFVWKGILNQDQTKQQLGLITTVGLGCGLFLYFQGRSHDYNYFACIYPAFFLLGMLIDRTVSPNPDPEDTSFFTRSFRWAGVGLLCVWASSFFYLSFKINRLVENRMNSPLSTDAMRTHASAEWYAHQVKAHEQVLVLSDNETHFHRLGKTRAFNKRGWVEVFPMKIADFRELNARIVNAAQTAKTSNPSEPIRVFASRSFLNGQTVLDPRILEALKEVLKSHFSEEHSSPPPGDLIEFLPKPTAAP